MAEYKNWYLAGGSGMKDGMSTLYLRYVYKFLF